MVKNGQLFLGEYEPNLTKGFRVALPKRIRDALLNEKEVILSKGFEGCIFGYSKSFFELESEKTLISNIADKHSRFLKRFLFGSAFEVEFDSQGRIILPKILVQEAQILQESQVILIGAGDHFEIWNRENWKLINNEMQKELL
ncbi:hypothetical protein KA001_00325 [Patescibacteria group bacterium]|nr:hypothetical protein [Patescibacteria group bacterium]